MIGAVVVGGRYLVRPALRFIARTDMREMFTAFALLLVVGIALMMDAVGLSMALGTFVAGVLLGFSSAVIVCHVLVVSLALLCGSPNKPPEFVTQSPLGREALSFHTFQQVMEFFDQLHT